MHLAPGQWIGGEFRIVRPLAEGGMGAIFVAEQRGTGKLRALKTLHALIAHDAAAVERFVREARVGASIASEHVVEVVSAGVDEPTGMAFIAMELLEGETLEARILSRGPMHPSEVVLVLRQLVHALSAAHRAGIVHRDLKPQNVMLVHARRGDSPFTVKVLDFGIAKLLESANGAGNSHVIGSPPWMAPEQLDAGAAITPATDVWSVGLITFFLLTARMYWRSANASIPALVAEIVLAPLEPASERARELDSPAALPHAFDAWFARAVARAASDRYPSVDAMLDALTTLVIAPSPTASLPANALLATRSASSAPPPGLRLSATSVRPAATTPGPVPSVRREATPSKFPKWIFIVGALVACLSIALPAGMNLVLRFVGPWAQSSLVHEAQRPDAENVAACRQSRACCEALWGPAFSSCAPIDDSLSAETCIRLTRGNTAGVAVLPQACVGPPANAVPGLARVRDPSIPPVPSSPSPRAPTPFAAPPTVTACVRATRCCNAAVAARPSLARDDTCDTVRRGMVLPSAAASCDTATRAWADRFRSAGLPVPDECQIPP